MKLIKKIGFSRLYIEKNNSSKYYELLKKKLPQSIFCILGINFFNKMVERDLISLFIIKNKNKIAGIITVIKWINYQKLKKKILFFIITHPHYLIFNIIFFIHCLKRDTNKSVNNKNHLHLLHLILIKKNFMNMSLNKKDKMINSYFKKITKLFDAKMLYLCYERNNQKASKFYKRNKFITFQKSKDILFVKKRFVK